MKRNPSSIGKYLSACLVVLAATFGVAAERQKPQQTATLIVQAGGLGCRVDLDAGVLGTTDASGMLTVGDIDPGDHYVHVRCPGKAEAGFFISPLANEHARIGPIQDASASSSATDPIVVANNKTQLQRLVQQAVQLRQQARLDEAVAALRQAMRLDPENADLHRELGITFLLAKEWKRARVEMIEAIHHDQTDADAHNGLGYALEKLGDIDGAVKEYRIATNLEPDDPSYRTHYFDALVKIQARKESAK
jgi:tetratricopeptide (TPR) repeat protein